MFEASPAACRVVNAGGGGLPQAAFDAPPYATYGGTERARCTELSSKVEGLSSQVEALKQAAAAGGAPPRTGASSPAASAAMREREQVNQRPAVKAYRALDASALASLSRGDAIGDEAGAERRVAALEFAIQQLVAEQIAPPCYAHLVEELDAIRRGDGEKAGLREAYEQASAEYKVALRDRAHAEIEARDGGPAASPQPVIAALQAIVAAASRGAYELLAAKDVMTDAIKCARAPTAPDPPPRPARPLPWHGSLPENGGAEVRNKICVTFGEPRAYIPVAVTCLWRLELRHYESKEKLVEDLRAVYTQRRYNDL